MSMLVLALCAGIATAFTLYAFHEWSTTIDHDPELESRRRILTELADIELHRPNHIIHEPSHERLNP